MAGNARNIPNYIKARSPQRLRVLMFQNNLRKSHEFKYMIQFAQGYWWAWYDEKAKPEASV